MSFEFWCRSSQTDLEELGELGDLLSVVVFKSTFAALPNKLFGLHHTADDKPVITWQGTWISLKIAFLCRPHNL